jgi:hypothetical protein
VSVQISIEGLVAFCNDKPLPCTHRSAPAWTGLLPTGLPTMPDDVAELVPVGDAGLGDDILDVKVRAIAMNYLQLLEVQ